MSSCEAEYMSVASAVKEALWLRKLAADLNLEVKTLNMYCDNQGSIKLLKQPMASARSNHIDVMHHFVRERVARGEVQFEYCSTERMVADIFTKALPVTKLEFCRQELGLVIFKGCPRGSVEEVVSEASNARTGALRSQQIDLFPKVSLGSLNGTSAPLPGGAGRNALFHSPMVSWIPKTFVAAASFPGGVEGPLGTSVSKPCSTVTTSSTTAPPVCTTHVDPAGAKQFTGDKKSPTAGTLSPFPLKVSSVTAVCSSGKMFSGSGPPIAPGPATPSAVVFAPNTVKQTAAISSSPQMRKRIHAKRSDLSDPQNTGYHVAVLTETQVTSDPSHLLRVKAGAGNIWPCVKLVKLYHTSGRGETAGVTIVISPNSNFLDDLVQVKNNAQDESGRILRLDFNMLGTPSTLIGAYCPAQKEERVFFFSELLSSSTSSLPPPGVRQVLLAGDFNCVISEETDVFYPPGHPGFRQGSSRLHGSAGLGRLMQEHNLVDIWRDHYPAELAFTHWSKASN
ncbi:hypothetical protein CEUSTIGMA_g13328.t1 [Chlamydomonas eustigma]|uniref:Endonuclease/exonuclease/phosphatase domain-containing protein n=1 Tax=Chlamydomonas eustigma TaxID=1157962 RepID=A0A250XSK8_9CHLO|nr:hypothetical protein CEUSTIGMA_g13328.t1 [Chlamydomonas eustigma]|eukprot:GAX85912.1 hypothetical protein CEUSTIGMA_g13328.t1 [Chlamydomonas eustigma]